MKVRKVLHADEGKVLTNGEIYGKHIFLAETENESSFYEITEEQFKEILKEQELRSEV